MKLDSLFEYLENLRREAYVKAVIRASESDDVLGFIGSDLPFDIFHALNLYAIPVYGVDGEILSFSREENLCPVIDATVTYAKTDKCPLIHSSKLIVAENFCPVMTRELQKLSRYKEIYFYESDSELKAKLFQVYQRELDHEKLIRAREDMKKASELFRRIKYHSDLTGKQVFILEYYTNFLSLNERINILQEIIDSGDINFSERETNYIPVRVQSGAGIYNQIDKLFAGRTYRILEDFCNVSANFDFVYKNCPYHKDNSRIINY